MEYATVFRARLPFLLDGVLYTGESSLYVGGMFSVRSTRDNEAARMKCDRPMTDDELNDYTATGYIHP